MNFTTTQVINKAKAVYSVNKGTAFIATILPALLAGLLNSFIQNTTSSFYIYIFVPILVSAVATYMTIKMILRIMDQQSLDFGSSFTPGGRLLRFIGVIAIFSVIELLLGEILSLIFVTNNTAQLISLLEPNNISPEIFWELFKDIYYIIIIQMVIMTFIRLRFFMSQYLVVEGTDLVSSFTQSYKNTKDNVWVMIKTYLYAIGLTLIIVIPLSFILFIPIIGFIILIVTVVGFLAPFLSLLFASLFIHLRGTENAEHIETYPNIETDENYF